MSKTEEMNAANARQKAFDQIKAPALDWNMKKPKPKTKPKPRKPC